MKSRRLIPIVVLFSVIGVDLWPVSPSDYRRRSPGTWRRQHDEKDYLFSGTGIFGKNRDPIESQQAKEWFLKAEDEEKKGDLRDALSYYEKFSKRRTDARIIRDGTEIQIGPESLFRAARIQEERGNWPKAFECLRLIAEAYTEYDFNKVDPLLNFSARNNQYRLFSILPSL